MDYKKEYIEQVLLNLYIDHYHINFDYSVDVYDSVNLVDYSSNLDIIPIVFNRVYGSFYVNSVNLKTLMNSPVHVDGNFDCSSNLIESLEHCPKFIGGKFKVSNNLIKSLDFFPETINSSINLSNNKLESLVGLPRVITGDLDISYNLLEKIDVSCDISGLISIRGNKFSKIIEDLPYEHKSELFEYGLDYNIFGNDDTINEKRLKSMLKEMNG